MSGRGVQGRFRGDAVETDPEAAADVAAIKPLH